MSVGLEALTFVGDDTIAGGCAWLIKSILALSV